jgi:hypothetical protein
MFPFASDYASLLHTILLRRSGGAIGFSRLLVGDYRFAQGKRPKFAS